MDINAIKSTYVNNITNYFVSGNVLDTLHVLTHWLVLLLLLFPFFGWNIGKLKKLSKVTQLDGRGPWF